MAIDIEYSLIHAQVFVLRSRRSSFYALEGYSLGFPTRQKGKEDMDGAVGVQARARARALARLLARDRPNCDREG